MDKLKIKKDNKTVLNESKYGLLFLIDRSNDFSNENNFILVSEKKRVVDILYEVLKDIYDDTIDGDEKDREVLKTLNFFASKYGMKMIKSEQILQVYGAEIEKYHYVLRRKSNGHSETFPCKIFYADYI